MAEASVEEGENRVVRRVNRRVVVRRDEPRELLHFGGVARSTHGDGGDNSEDGGGKKEARRGGRVDKIRTIGVGFILC
jgi:hypothetical protein